ncbi:Alpha/beta hydrolase-3 [Melia azedarach]|uniref:Alpha/beta hydrolase-3 n=1 Tax=Melia azedarach TaxID=155640 RepID=A0ACC1Y183_MELAZ|nr:Alpha/beta hydrolase-3 [Melia azedarach]
MSDEQIPTKPNADMNFPITGATADPDEHTVALSKDVTLNQINNTWVRIFLPRETVDSSSSSCSNKLPLIVYFHGGGFTVLSPATKMNHEFCSELSAQLSCVIISVAYRLAPDHRLPAAYDDAMEALHWIKTTQEEWLQKYADFSSSFMLGDSAGGNIAYHAGLRAACEVHNLLPLNIRGLILFKPFFGGVKRTESELRLANELDLPLSASDSLWKLSLPIGVDRDHEYCNPMAGEGSKLLEQFKLLGWKIMVSGGYTDPLVDRQIELVKMMEDKGVKVESHFDESGHRTKDFIDPAKRNALYAYIKNFLLSTSAVADTSCE